MPGQGVAPRRLHEQVVRAITERIVSGEFASGESLPSEAEMCADYGVSRSSVREALRVLAEKGLVEVRQGLGTRVRPPESWDFLDTMVLSVRRERGAMVAVIRDLLEARRMVEVEVAGLAAARAREADLALLEASLETMRTSMDDPQRYAAADFAFHRVLLEATGNRVLVRMAEPIRELLEYSLQTTDSIPHVLERALNDHTAIYRAVRRRDVDGARDAMREHLERTERDLATLARDEQG